jgi:Zn-dependent M16 (insulinase) family peptidase
MLTRSLATFMNAFTATDFTMYPFSTINEKDYSNLMSVYLDAAFFPNLFEQDFKQEGWRLEHADPTDATSALIFKGVVYNEMKGYLSSSDAIYRMKASQALFSDGPYRHYSGGDPAHIPELSWSQLKKFHSELYHPSNALFYSYGDLPVERHLQQVQEDVLSKFSDKQVISPVLRENRWASPRTAKLTGPADPMAADQSSAAKISIAYLLTDICDVYECFALRILTSLLVDGPTSLFYRQLIESGLGSDFSPNTYFDDQGKDTSFAIGVQGANADQASAILERIRQTFERASVEPFDNNDIESILHQIELGQKHQSTNFGLNLASALMPTWTHNGQGSFFFLPCCRVVVFFEIISHCNILND